MFFIMLLEENQQASRGSDSSYVTISLLFEPDIGAVLLENEITSEQEAQRVSSVSDMSVLSESPSPADKTLLEYYWYNLFMTLFQDIPQSAVTLYIMTHGGLKDDPDNPTGVSLPGYLNLIPQFGNTAAGLAAGCETIRLIKHCHKNFSIDKAFYAALYSIFSVSTVVNGVTNIESILSNESEHEANFVSNLSTVIALLANFIILCREEAKLTSDLYCNDNEKGKFNKKLFHLICSINLNVSIITSFLVTSGNISLTLGACGYLFGTWLGQVPELVEPTMERLGIS